MLIELTDGGKVVDPIVIGKNWIIRFDDDGCEFMVRTYRKPSKLGLLKRMRKILRTHNIKAELDSKTLYFDCGAFPPRWRNLHDCGIVELALIGSLPRHLLSCARNLAED